MTPLLTVPQRPLQVTRLLAQSVETSVQGGYQQEALGPERLGLRRKRSRTLRGPGPAPHRRRTEEGGRTMGEALPRLPLRPKSHPAPAPGPLVSRGGMRSLALALAACLGDPCCVLTLGQVRETELRGIGRSGLTPHRWQTADRGWAPLSETPAPSPFLLPHRVRLSASPETPSASPNQPGCFPCQAPVGPWAEAGWPRGAGAGAALASGPRGANSPAPVPP